MDIAKTFLWIGEKSASTLLYFCCWLVDPLNGFGRLLLYYMDPHVMWQWLALGPYL